MRRTSAGASFWANVSTEHPQRPETVRLEHQKQSAREGMQRVERGGDLVGVVRKVVDHRNAARFADDLEPAADAGETRQRLGRLREAHAAGLRGAQRR
jgi:hypothetical protein